MVAKPGSAVMDKPCAFLEEMEHSADKGQRWAQFADGGTGLEWERARAHKGGLRVAMYLIWALKDKRSYAIDVVGKTDVRKQ